jgi:chemotaxis protein histidine kinase CheA
VTSQLNGTANGHYRAVPHWDGWQPITPPGQEPTTPPKRSRPAPGHEYDGVTIADPWNPGKPFVSFEESARAQGVTVDATKPVPAEDAAPTVDHVALAEADRIRKLADAEADALRIEAEGKAEAERIRAVEEARKLKLANDKAEQQARERQEASEARIAESRRKREEAERARADAEQQTVEERKAKTEQQAKSAKSAKSWRRYALGFAIVCAIVALPVQMSAFYSKSAPWLLAAPLVLEGGAWVVLKGAAAAVDEHRPHWHYRLIAWTLAALAAGINLSHGLTHFGRATAIGTAFASLAGPGVWDLHEHGRIRTRDGKLARRERKTQEKAEKRAAAEKAAERKRAEAERKAAEEATKQAAEELAKKRETTYGDEWKHALALAAALGETTVTEAVWRRAWYDLHGTEPGDTVDIIRGRNTAARRLAAAVSEAPGNTPSKVTNAQRAIQIKTSRERSSYRPVPPVRQTGDTLPYHPAARRAIGDAKRRSNAARRATRED